MLHRYLYETRRYTDSFLLVRYSQEYKILYQLLCELNNLSLSVSISEHSSDFSMKYNIL